MTPPGSTANRSGIGRSEPVVVENGPLPVNATAVYRRVERLTAVDAPAPTVVVTGRGPINLSMAASDGAYEALGHESRGSLRNCGQFYPARAWGDEVRVATGNLSASTIELVLVHEFTHVLQENVSGYDRIYDGRWDLSQTLSEGSAVYVANEYAEQYDLRWDDRTPLEIRECLYERAGDVNRRLAGRYFLGGRYFDRRLDSPANLSAVYRSPPQTMEQVIHGLGPSDEPVADLSVGVEESDGWTERRRRGMGELELRVWLHTALPADRVDVAASGWGNDALVRFGRDERASVAWVLRLDAASDADELATAVADVAATLEARNATSVRGVRVSNRTVVVFAGDASFVEDATATGTTGNVTVVPP